MKKIVVAMALAVAAVLAPSALAKAHKPAVKLPLVPLQAAQLGAVASSLPLEHGSGVVTNKAAAANANDSSVTAKKIAKLGRVTGYALEYGNPFLPGSGVREVATGVERYKSVAAAKRGLGFWRGDDAKATTVAQFGVSPTLSAVRTPAVGTGHWAFAITLSVTNTDPVYVLDEDVQDGAYVLSVTVAAGSLAPAKKLAPKLARMEDTRLRAMLAGKLRGKAARLPAKLKAGPPTSGPDPAKAALTTSDLGQATLAGEKYVVDEAALSEYDVTYAPAGNFDYLFQSIIATSTPSEATYYAAMNASTLQGLAVDGNTLTPVDVSGAGDDAFGALLELHVSGQTVYEAAVVLENGPIFEVVVAAAKTPLADSDVTNLAQLAANKLNAAVAG